ncbi:hypothetical protein J6590_069709 [Homalodisca vitripennis]|nr:hypothetical protein J6590_069709 [Homalodisca vitripennis]
MSAAQGNLENLQTGCVESRGQTDPQVIAHHRPLRRLLTRTFAFTLLPITIKLCFQNFSRSLEPSPKVLGLLTTQSWKRARVLQSTMWPPQTPG